MNEPFELIGRWLRTVRFLRSGQIICRARLVGRRRWWRLTGATCPTVPSPQWRTIQPAWSGLATLPQRPDFAVERVAAGQQAEAVAARRFCFLGHEVAFVAGVDWHLAGVSQLWRYHLHYFDFVRSLLIAAPDGNGSTGYAVFRALAQSWITGNRALRGDGWHPYTLSLRIVNWLHVAAAWPVPFERDSEFRATFSSSLFAQARLLRRQLEFDVRGNHLLENLRALLWAGSAFEGTESREWFDTALGQLESELAEQILPDGGHFERTPGYHALVLNRSLEIALLLERNAGGCPSWLRAAIQRQAVFLREIVGPDRRVPLLKDTAYDAMPDADELLNQAAVWLDDRSLKPAVAPRLDTWLKFGGEAWSRVAAWPLHPVAPGGVALRSSGYYVMRSAAGDRAVVDAGQPCPDYLPAHAHADTLGYEYHFRGRPVVVDSGVFEYQAGPWRDYFRSTRAHSTVEISGQNSSEVWSSFRVGRRARATVGQWSSGPGETLLFAAHDGYRWLPGSPLHERAVIWRDDEYFIVVDRVTGAAPHAIVNRVHLHPDLTLYTDGPGRWRVDVAGVPLWLHQIGSGQPIQQIGLDAPEVQGWYSERFGEKRASLVLAFNEPPAMRHVSGYVFSPDRDLKCSLSFFSNDVKIFVQSKSAIGHYVISDHEVTLSK